MKQIHEAVQALESDIGFWRPSWILLKKLKNAKQNYRANSLGQICILQSFYYQNHTKNKSVHVQGKVFPLNQTKLIQEAVQARERHRILAAILDFAKEAEKRANMHTANI